MINLVIVKPAKSRKTTLTKKLTQLRARQKPKDEISIWNWEISDGGKIYFRIWNFPSQVCIYVCIDMCHIHISYILLMIF